MRLLSLCLCLCLCLCLHFTDQTFRCRNKSRRLCTSPDINMPILLVRGNDSMAVVERQSAVGRIFDAGLLHTACITLVALRSDAEEGDEDHTDKGNAGGKPEDTCERRHDVVPIVSRLRRIPFNSVENGSGDTVADGGAKSS